MKKKYTIKFSALFFIIIASIVIISYLNNNDILSNRSSTKNTSNIYNSEQSGLTEDILGFNSQYGALPNSLDGTLLDINIKIDDQGHLVITDDIKYLFDYFLSTNSEESIDIILLRISEYLKHTLQEPALSESLEILEQYISLKTSLVKLEQQMGKNISTLDQEQLKEGQYFQILKYRLSQRNKLRAEYLDPEVHQEFYQAEETYDDYTYSKLLLQSDQSLSTEEKQDQLQHLQQSLPEDIREGMKETQIIDELQEKTANLIATGGDSQQLYELRRSMFNEEAAQRFVDLDQQRDQWQKRVDDYLIQRNAILNSQGLTQEELQQQANTLRDLHFDSDEYIKILVYEKRSEKNNI
jgi:lipase chaperone LimK